MSLFSTKVELRIGGGAVQTVVENIAYAPFGRPEAWDYGNGVAMTRTPDLAGRVAQVSHGSLNLHLDYDKAGNILQRWETSTSNYPIYQYDYLNRVDYITLDAQVSHDYGKYGDTIRIPRNKYCVPFFNENFSHGDNNRLRHWDIEYYGVPEYFGRVDYTHNALGQRVQRTVDSAWTPAGTAPNQIYHYDDANHLVAVEGTNGYTYEFVYLDDEVVGYIGYDGSNGGGNGTLYFYHTDPTGIPMAATDGNGVTVMAVEYGEDPFGLVSVGSGIGTNPGLHFPGQIKDPWSGLHYNYYRDYDARVGRYLQSDPIGLEGGINTYTYAANNPLRYTDPSGLIFGTVLPQVPGEEPFEFSECVLRCMADVIGLKDLMVAGGIAASAPIATKPRKGISGGGPSGDSTSPISKLAGKMGGRKSPVGSAIREVGRIAGRVAPISAAALLGVDSALFAKCLEVECADENCPPK